MLQSWLSALPKRPNQARKGRQSYHPCLEALEDRVMLDGNPILTVNTKNDGNVRDTVLTLREAIMVANGDLAKNALTAQEQAQIQGEPTAASLDTIKFNIPNQETEIKPTNTALPTITRPVVLDGTGGYILDGSNFARGPV